MLNKIYSNNNKNNVKQQMLYKLTVRATLANILFCFKSQTCNMSYMLLNS